MSRDTSPYIVGDHWLDKRRDGASPDIWQIAWYKPASRQIVYRSTHKRSVEDAKPVIHAHVDLERAKRPQAAEDARVIPLLMAYWSEAGQHKINKIQAASSIRAFIGFLMQDSLGVNAVVTDMTPVAIERFRVWRMGPHEFSVPWAGKDIPLSSQGVGGATVDRMLNDVRAAINHAEANMRLPYAPKIKALDERYRSEPRERVLSLQELGHIAWYSFHFPDLFRFVALQLGTAVRPNAAKAFDPRTQFIAATNNIDLQPDAKPQTKKRNAILPAIRPLRVVLKAWAADDVHIVASRKTAWRTMRHALELGSDVHAKTIRHTVATMLYSDPSVPERQVSELLGHMGKLARTTRIYAKYDPNRLREAARSLSRIWLAVSREARRTAAVQTLSIGKSYSKTRIDRASEKD